MKVRLLVDQRVAHKAGETVEVSPAVADFLFSVHAAERLPVKEAKKNDKNTKASNRD